MTPPDPQQVAEIAGRLSKAQREAVFPGPGNPAYARGPMASMRALERMGVVKHIHAFGFNGKRGAALTELGAAVRNFIQGNHHD